MSEIDKALQTQLTNIQKKTGKTLDELFEVARQSGLARHGAIVSLLKSDLAMGHGDANAIAHLYLKAAETPGKNVDSADEGAGMLDDIYSGSKASLRPIHEAVMAEIQKLGEFEIAPKKGYVSLRRKRQFAMVGAGTRGRVEVGLNMKGLDATDRLQAMAPGGMCQYKVFLSAPGEVDEELLAWVRQAYESAG